MNAMWRCNGHSRASARYALPEPTLFCAEGASLTDEEIIPGLDELDQDPDSTVDDLRGLLVDEDVDGEPEEDDRHRRRNVLVWLIILLLLLLLCCCCWRYGRWWKAPDQRDVAGEEIKTATIPDVTGMKREDAIKILEAAGFNVEVETSYDVEADPDTVVSQDPPGGPAVIGSTVFITVTEPLARGQGSLSDRDGQELAEVPDVEGLPRSVAIDDIKNAGFRVRVTGVYSDSVPAGFVISQTPGPGASAPVGSTVSILISLGTEPVDTVPMPNVVGKSAADAAAAIRAAGLEPRLLYQPHKGYVGKVYQQSPQAGTAVPEDRLVFVLIGLDYWWKAPSNDRSGGP